MMLRKRGSRREIALSKVIVSCEDEEKIDGRRSFNISRAVVAVVLLATFGSLTYISENGVTKGSLLVDKSPPVERVDYDLAMNMVVSYSR